MPVILPAYAKVVEALKPLLFDLPGKLVGIDGRNGIGKTTLGRYLAWKFNISLIEGDLFLKVGRGTPKHYLDEINRIIQFRLDKPRPVILESIGLFHILERLGRRSDFVIYCHSDNYDADDELRPWLDEYDHTYAPRHRANVVADITHADS